MGNSPCKGEAISEPDSSDLVKLNDSIWQLHEPRFEELHEMDVIFFHGLQESNDGKAFWKTWVSRDKSVIWPKAWLGECFPNARILSVSYDIKMDPFLIVENLMQDIIWSPRCKAGQNSPVIFVGHCLGGIIIKEFLLKCRDCANSKDEERGLANQVKSFLRNCKGIFYYSTPHAGSAITCPKEITQPIREYLTVLSEKTARTNHLFDKLRNSNDPDLKLATWTIGETLETEFQLQEFKFKGVLVPEASARRGTDLFYSTDADHFDVSRAKDKSTCIIFTWLRDFIGELTKDSPWNDLQRLVNGLTSDHNKKQEECAKALANLACGDLEICREIGNFPSACERLIKVLTKNSGSTPDAQRYSAMALVNLTAKANHDLELQIINVRGALEELVNGLNSDDNRSLQKQCARVLANLACGDLEICGKIGDFPSACEGLVKVLKDSGSCPDAQRYSARVLANLASKNNHDLRLKITNAPGVLQELVNGLYNDDNRDLQLECAGALANLACGDFEIRRKIRNFPKALVRLDKVAKDSDSNPDAQTFSKRALHDLKSGSRSRLMLKSLRKWICVV